MRGMLSRDQKSSAVSSPCCLCTAPGDGLPCSPWNCCAFAIKTPLLMTHCQCPERKCEGRLGRWPLLAGPTWVQMTQRWSPGALSSEPFAKALLPQFPYLETLFSEGPAAMASLVAQSVKNSPTVQETRVQSLGWKDPLDKGMTTHSSILA